MNNRLQHINHKDQPKDATDAYSWRRPRDALLHKEKPPRKSEVLITKTLKEINRVGLAKDGAAQGMRLEGEAVMTRCFNLTRSTTILGSEYNSRHCFGRLRIRSGSKLPSALPHRCVVIFLL